MHRSSLSLPLLSPSANASSRLPVATLALLAVAPAPEAVAQPTNPYGYMTLQAPRGPFFGETAALPGDLDGDGHADYAVGNRVEVAVYSGRTGKEMGTLPILAGNAFERYLEKAGDVDNDGTPDLIASWADWNNTRGLVQVFSGRTYAELHRFTGTNPIDNYGRSLADAGDVDGDGWDDIIIGADMIGQQWSPGYAEVRSGRTGAVLHRWDGRPNTDDVIGFSVAGAGDIDGDGYDDLVVGRFGGAEVYSGRTGAELLTWTGTTRSFGAESFGAGDIDGDGVPDVAIGGSRQGFFVYSAADGSLISRVASAPSKGRLTFFRLLGDVDGDGRAEHAVGGPGGPSLPGYVDVISIDASGAISVRFTVQGNAIGDNFGWAIDAGGDVNADGVPDVVVSAPQQPVPGSGYARVVSGTRLGLLADSHCLPLSSGGVQTMTLWAGEAHAARPYWVLGSTTGSRPPIAFGPCSIPLVADWYTERTVAAPNVAPLASSAGTLDGAGFATATFALPAGLPPALAGMTIWHAYVVFDPSFSVCVRDSNAMPVTLTQ